MPHTIMSLIEEPGAKTFSGALLFRAILGIMGGRLKCVTATWLFKQLRQHAKPQKQFPPQAISSKPGCHGCHYDPEQHVMFEICIYEWIP